MFFKMGFFLETFQDCFQITHIGKSPWHLPFCEYACLDGGHMLIAKGIFSHWKNGCLLRCFFCLKMFRFLFGVCMIPWLAWNHMLFDWNVESCWKVVADIPKWSGRLIHPSSFFRMLSLRYSTPWVHFLTQSFTQVVFQPHFLCHEC